MNRNSLTRWDAVKIIALLLMFVDHAGYFYFEQEQWIRGIGRACAPIFLFLVGFAPHYRFDKKLFLLALLLTAYDWWMQGAPNTLNILCSILLIRLLLDWLEQRSLFRLKLHEWVIGALALIPIVLLTQYGSLGFLFALAGFVFKHRTYYDAKTPDRFLWLVTLLYGVIIALLSEFTPLTIISMTASLIPMVLLLQWFTRAPTTTTPYPVIAKPFSRYTVEIYVVHLIVLIGLTGKAL